MSEPILLRIDDIMKLCHISRRYLQVLRLRGDFPAPTRNIGRMPAWHREVIEQWARGEWQPERPARQRRAAVATK